MRSHLLFPPTPRPWLGAAFTTISFALLAPDVEGQTASIDRTSGPPFSSSGVFLGPGTVRNQVIRNHVTALDNAPVVDQGSGNNVVP